jgi:hypothetical protein
MEHIDKHILKMEKLKVLELIFFQMDLIIQDNLKMIYLMDRVNSTIDQIE